MVDNPSHHRAIDASPEWARGVRIWFLVLLAGVCAAFPLLLEWGGKQWIFMDEWSFLVDRRLTDPVSMLKSHFGHWVTVPAVIYRVLYNLFGLRSYAVYQIPAILIHLAIVVIVWLTMRRLGVRAAIATASALPFVLYGAGNPNILWGFQITLTGAVMFGLAYLLVVTVDTPTLRHDLAGMALGLLAIMCSAVGVPIVGGVAIALFILRGWRPAALHALVLALVYIAWYISFLSEEDPQGELSLKMIEFVRRLVQETFVGFGQNRLAALAIAGLAAIGVAHTIRLALGGSRSQSPGLVAALIGSSVGFATLTAFGRASLDETNLAPSGRYMYVVAALLRPIIALGGEVLARRWWVLGVVPFLLMLVGLPENIDLLRHRPVNKMGNRGLFTAIA